MSRAAELAEHHAAALRAIAETLPQRFLEAAGALEERLGEAELREWARSGLGLARLARGAPEVAVAFFETSPAVGVLDVAALSRWADLAAGLADRAPQVAVAFLESTPAALTHLGPHELAAWAGQGQRLCRGSWKSAALAAGFFRLGPTLFDSLSGQAFERLVDLVARLAPRSDETASQCLHDAPSLCARLAESDRAPFLAYTQALCGASWTDVSRCFERGPALLEAVHAEQRGGFLELAARAASATGREGFPLFVAAAEALAALDPERQAEVLAFAQRLAAHDARAAVESVASAPAVHRRLSPEGARRWREAGLALLLEGQSAERAESYFRIESALAEEMLAELAARVALTSVAGVLRLYAKALTGEQLLVQQTPALVGRNIGWKEASASTTDGSSIFLPAQVDLFGEAKANFQVYKVHATHQAARLEFGSFHYRFGVDGTHLPSTVRDRERRRRGAGQLDETARRDPPAAGAPPSSSAISPMQRLFDLFDDRRLASDLFALVEDARIDARVRREYPGMRRWLRRLQELEAEQRPDVRRMALRQAFVENLLRASLGQPAAILWPAALHARLERAVAALRVVERSGATVQDTAEVMAALYDLAIAIPNLPPWRVPGAWSGLDEEAVSRGFGPNGTEAHSDERLPEGEEVAYAGPARPAYRGDFKPELVQLLDELTRREGAAEGGAPLTREQILELLESSAELELGEEAEDGAGALEALLTRIEDEAAERANDAEAEDAAAAVEDAEPGIEWFRYDEWDFRANDYRPGWCRVGERKAAEGALDFYDETLRRYHGLVVETRRQFERMRPESFRRLKRLEDGHEIDLDQAIEFRADTRAGAGPLARFYTRRNKIKRDVAVAFLLDMSGSTSEEILQPAGSPLAGARPAPERSADGGKRIIDVEREATVLAVEALEAIGDAYGIYGFSGHGRENVEFHVIKDLDEPCDDAVRRRIDKIEPVRSTRMGPAIRHATAKLSLHDAKVKILILISDGRPQDEGYGPDGSEKEYAVHDTKRALVEAKHQRIAPFLITVDSAGHDYLRHMCDDMGYEVVVDIESLPRRLPKLYRHVAAE